MNLWLIPASDEAAQTNIPKTLSAEISAERASKAGILGNPHAWGAKASSDLNVNKFAKMAAGDFCLFYTQSIAGGQKRYRWKAVITETRRSPQLAQALWDDAAFELVYFLRDVRQTDLTTDELSAGFAEFRQDYFSEAPKGFTAVDPDVVHGIISHYGDIDAWVESLERTMRFWVEKTIVARRPDRQTGEHALGRAMWSPQRAEGDRDIYRSMRDVKPGDIVFHFVDNERVDSYSSVSGKAEDSFVGLPETEWADRPAYRIPLSEHTKIVPPIGRNEFLGENSAYRPIIRELLESETGLFFNREFNLNQGSYITAAPIKLIQIWNDIHLKQTGEPLNPDWKIPPLDTAKNTHAKVAMHEALEFSTLREIEEVFRAAGLRTPPFFLRRLIASLAAKPFVILTGTSGTGKTKVAQALARWLTPDKANYVLIPVGADWTGNENIVGYPDGLNPNEYVSKPALELFWRASHNQDEAHFLILDEMNLSHVERYFADLLSAIESAEPIPLYSGPPRKLSGGDLPNALALARNVFIIGTVNVDETTYMFSPKVLDRANVLEFRVDTDDLVSYFSAAKTTDLLSLTGKGKAFGSTLVHAVNRQADVPEEVNERFRAEMLIFFNALKPHGAEFGYRVIQEASRFASFFHELADNSEHWFDQALDAIVVQKFLPKLHGQRTRLAPVLRKLWYLCTKASDKRGANVISDLEEVSRSTERNVEPVDGIPAEAPYKLSAEKISRMWRLLNENGFASFAEA